MTRQTITSVPRRTRKAALREGLERRIERVAVELENARAQLHEAQEAVHAAEDTLFARRMACEAAALHIAELAELLECLEK